MIEQQSKLLGIIGGLGPETGFSFSLATNNAFSKITKSQMHIIVDNLPINIEDEKKAIQGNPSGHLIALISSVKRLNKIPVDLIVIPCNTVHVFITELRTATQTPILSIIEVTAAECKKQNLTKVGLLASQATINQGIYKKELEKVGIALVLPIDIFQKEINEIIIKIIHNNTTQEDKHKVELIIKTLKENGAQAVILGCTDLPLIVKESELPLINSLKILETAAVQTILAKTNQK